ncbi:ester cyclase [Natronococcus wangiae]|uniref:ester cyclase n=1 Tax=Natronococcus wangiae TaxID=3068275 RepID=UPI00273E2A87|nr:ester cyclase [Natronococcus sp. AD5]
MTPPEAMTPTEENADVVIRASFETYTEGATEEIDELVSEEYVLHDPTSPEEIRGREEFREHVESIRSAFPDLSATIEHIVAKDDSVAVRFTVRGTYEGAESLPGLDVEPTGESFEIDGMEFDRLEDGMLAETWLSLDTYGLMEQLGVLSEAGAPGTE